MSGNNEGTPNPLNPGFGYPGAGTPRSEMPTSDADAPVDPMVEALNGSAEYNNVVENTVAMTGSMMPRMTKAPQRVASSGSTMPQMASAPARPTHSAMRTNQPVIDPMMRHAKHEPVMVETVETVTVEDSYPYSDDGSNYSHSYDSHSDRVATGTFRTEKPSYTNEPTVQATPIDIAKSGGKSKKPLIITLMILFMTALVCGIAALIIFVFPKSDDRMAVAINRVLDGNMSSIINAKGNITISSDDIDTQFSQLSIDLDATIDTKSAMQKADATITADLAASLASKSSLEFDISEIGTKNGTKYIKLNNVVNALNEVMPSLVTNMSSVTVNGLTIDNSSALAQQNSNVTDTMTTMVNLFQTFDGKWIMIPNTSSGIEFTEGLDGMGIFGNQTACLTNVLIAIPTYGNDLVSKYKNNQFITYTTEGVAIAKKHDTLYRLGFDDTKFAAFINSLPNSGFTNALNACAGNSATNQPVSAAEIAKIFSGYPDLYVEVDDKGNITRVYFSTKLSGGLSVVKADFSLSYPSELKITEPSEYLDLNNIVMQLMSAFMNGNNTDNQEIVVEEEIYY